MANDREEWLKNPRIDPGCQACGDSGVRYVRGHDAAKRHTILRFGKSRTEAEPYWTSASGLPKIPVECRCVKGRHYEYDPDLPGDERCGRCAGKGWYTWEEGVPIPDDVKVLGQTFAGRDRVECGCKAPSRESIVETLDLHERKPARGEWDWSKENL